MSETRAGIIAFLGGFSVMSLELTAVRLLAPYFGDSAFVWTNVIGVMLAALAMGAWLGGRLADASMTGKRLSILFVVSGLLTACVPLLAQALGPFLLPSDLLLEDAMPALVRGSLAATLILFAPPVALIGCVTPLLVTGLSRSGMTVGRASGLIAATSTLGSLAGTFATTHLLVPELGSRITVWISAGLLLGCGLLARRSVANAIALLIPVTLACIPWSQGRSVDGSELLAEVESSYQLLRVYRSGEEDLRRTTLKINEGLDSFHSIAIEGTPFTGGAYYDYHALVPFLVGDGKRPVPLRVASLGCAAGTFSRLYAAVHPDCILDGVEIDPAVVALGEIYFGGRPTRGAIHAGLDARIFVDHAKGPYEVILADAYERQAYIPAHVASREFFTSAKALLATGGILSANVGGLSFKDPVVAAIGRTMASVFGSAWAFRVPRSRNFMLLARKDGEIDPSIFGRVTGESAEMTVLVTAADKGAWHRFTQKDSVLIDDRPLLDSLQERQLASLPKGEATVFTGDRDPDAVAAGIDQELVAADPEAVIERLLQAKVATPLLRQLVGDARWHLRDLAGARMEYQAGLTLGPSDDMRGVLEARDRAAMSELAPALRAAEIAGRNGYLAAAMSLLAVAIFFGLHRRIR